MIGHSDYWELDPTRTNCTVTDPSCYGSVSEPVDLCEGFQSCVLDTCSNVTRQNIPCLGNDVTNFLRINYTCVEGDVIFCRSWSSRLIEVIISSPVRVCVSTCLRACTGQHTHAQALTHTHTHTRIHKHTYHYFVYLSSVVIIVNIAP